MVVGVLPRVLLLSPVSWLWSRDWAEGTADCTETGEMLPGIPTSPLVPEKVPFEGS